MCGIVFAYRPDLESDLLTRALRAALETLSRRGPDGSGATVQRPWAIGHRRLAVIDPRGSAQPMSDSRKRFFLSCNGEVYNYGQLRDELGRRWPWQTRGDIEVALAGLVLEGAAFLERMEGQWALALWDREKSELLLVRDRMGKKPLFYLCDGRRLACASELGALARLSWLDWSEDPNSTADYLRYGYYLPGSTAYRGIREVLPGHVLHWAPGGQVRQSAYWRLTLGGFEGDRRHGADLVRARFIEAVQRRLVADVEVGALLSGGVDSSLVVAAASRQTNRPLKTFTMGFSQAGFDERGFARRVSRRCRTRHYEACLDTSVDLPLISDRVLGWTHQPFADNSIVPTAGVCRLAAQQVKVVLSGDGGDELFSGYQRYLGRSLLRWYTRLPRAMRTTAERVVAAFAEPTAHHSAQMLKKAHLFMDAARRLESETPYVAPRFYADGDLRQLAPEIWQYGHAPPFMPSAATLDDLQRMMAADALIYLPQDILTKIDRAGMACGLEVRSPFLDRALVELAFSLPRLWHRSWGRGKRMLAAALFDRLPAWVWRRRKHGFGTPVHQWFRGHLEMDLSGLLHRVDHCLNTKTIGRMIALHRAGRRDHGQRLWQLYIYLRWLEKKPWRPS